MGIPGAAAGARGATAAGGIMSMTTLGSAALGTAVPEAAGLVVDGALDAGRVVSIQVPPAAAMSTSAPPATRSGVRFMRDG